MAGKNNGFRIAVCAGACAVAIIGGVILTRHTVKRNEDKRELAEVTVSTEDDNDYESDLAMINGELRQASGDYKDVVSSVLEEHADELNAKGITLEDAATADVQETSTGNYIIIVGDKFIFINSIDDLFYIDNVSNYFGTGNEGEEIDELYRNVYDTLYHNPDVLYAANVTLDDLWNEVCNGDYGIQGTDSEGVYTIKYNRTMISVDITNNVATVIE